MEKGFILSRYTIKIKEDDKKVILWHSFNGAIIDLEKEVFEKLVNKTFDNSVPYFEDLEKCGFVVNKNVDEFALVKQKEDEKIAKDSSKISVIIAPSLKCNYKCVYCFEANKEKQLIMDEQTANDVVAYIKRISQANSVKYISITWFGGEPMVCYDIICKIGEQVKQYAAEKNIHFISRMITNGSLLDKQKLDNLINKANLSYIQITVDGLEEVYVKQKGTTKEMFKRVINNICDFCDKVKINIRLNVCKENYDDAKAVAYYLLKEKNLANKITIHFAEIKNYNKDNNYHYYTIDEATQVRHNFYEELSNEALVPKSKYGIIGFDPLFCGFKIRDHIVIGPKGEFYKCEHHIGEYSKIVGNVKTGIVDNEALKSFYHPKYNPICEKCNLYPICRYVNCVELFKMVNFENGECSIYSQLLNSIKFQVNRYLNSKDE